MWSEMNQENDLERYYDERARIYEDIYRRDDPVRQVELNNIAVYLKEKLLNRQVLEIACGTGFWSEKVADVVSHLTGIDTSNEMLEIARQKRWPTGKVDFLEADAFALEEVNGDFEAALAVFWFSHVPKSRIRLFLDVLHRRIGEGAAVIMADNMFNDGLGGELVRPEESEDTFKLRELPDGSQHLVLKNYYNSEELRNIFVPEGAELDIHVGKCYWWVSYRVKRGSDKWNEKK
jgi:SAM-dependent methyltransferase